MPLNGELTNAALAQKVNSLLTLWREREVQFREWLNGTVDGGPNGDGKYPLSDQLGHTQLVPSPAALADLVSGPAGAASDAADEAASSADAAASSAAAASTSASNAFNHETGALSAKDAAEVAQSAAENAATTAIAQAVLARDWASKMDGPVSSGLYSARYYAQSISGAVSDAQQAASDAASAASTAQGHATSAASSASSAASSASSASSSASAAASSASSAASAAATAVASLLAANNTWTANNNYTGRVTVTSSRHGGQWAGIDLTGPNVGGGSYYFSVLGGTTSGGVRQTGVYAEGTGWQFRFDDKVLTEGTVPVSRVTNGSNTLLNANNTWNGANAFDVSSGGPLTVWAANGSPWAIALHRNDYADNTKVFAHNYGQGLAWSFEDAPYLPGIVDDSSAGRIITPSRGYGGYTWEVYSPHGTYGSMRLLASDGSTRSWWYGDTSGHGFLTTAGAWALRITAGNLLMGHLPFTSSALSGGVGARYGGIDVRGVVAGWTGINFSESPVDLLWDINGQYQGAHHAGNGWQWRFNNGVLDTGTVPVARISGLGSAAHYDGAMGWAGAGHVPIFDGSGYLYTHYINSNTGNNENPAISQVIVTNGSDHFYRKASIQHLANSLPSVPSAQRLGSLSHGEAYHLQHNWTGSHWYLQGYYYGSYHAEVRVGYADSALGIPSITISTSAPSGTPSENAIWIQYAP